MGNGWYHHLNIANLRYPAKNYVFCWLVDIPMNTKRLRGISLYPCKIDLVMVFNDNDS